jgi:hypothetical protein
VNHENIHTSSQAGVDGFKILFGSRSSERKNNEKITTAK